MHADFGRLAPADNIWTYMSSYGPFTDAAAFAAWVQSRIGLDDPYSYAVVDNTSRAIGIATLMEQMIAKGRNRDTAFYSMLDSEWPARKAAFERWLALENFDSKGQQIESLSALNGRS